MKTSIVAHDPRRRSQPAPWLRSRGFALVVTLSLMILLTIIAVGLLTLSGVALRSTGQTADMQTARANARLALILAINQLQAATGPDQCVIIPADQRSANSDGSKTSAAAGNQHWTGVFRSWPATSTTRPDPQSQFLSWLVSGDPQKSSDLTLAETSAASPIELVGSGTLGDQGTSGTVNAPAIGIVQGTSKPARMAWWVGDQGQKAALATPVSAPVNSALGIARSNLQSAARNAVQIASNGSTQPFENLTDDDSRTALVTSWKQSQFLAADPAAPAPLFHDLAPWSTGLLTNVTSGGFRKDLSLQLETTASKMPKDALYTVGSGTSKENGINLGELWVYYNSHLQVKRSGSFNFTTGGKLTSKTPYLATLNASSAPSDDFFHLKQPVVISYQMVLSFKTVPVSSGSTTVNRLHVVSDPVVTLWNPLDIPVVVPTDAFISVKYWQIPYDILVSVNGNAPVRAPLAASLSGATSSSDADQNYISIQIGTSGGGQLVFKPGEVIKFSQSGGMVTMSAGASNKNQLVAKKGFNYGGGYAMPMRDLAGKTIDLKKDDRITYQAIPNNITAGKKGSSGNSVTGRDAHSRHFSLTHHEVYVGYDRKNFGPSLGYGGMYIDWDFGNKRLKPGQVRGTYDPGTKPTSERLYADRFPDFFKPITTADARPLSFNQLAAEKSPFLLLSYDAKTEFGSATGTRFLSRFNPKAHHVDFYNLTPTEQDMLPYEFRAEPLVSWVNRSLDVSSTGAGFFGGGMNAQDGTSLICSHSIPREPPVSLAAFQHSFANGFEIHRPVDGYATLNGREPLMPQVSHAIGNSIAPAIMNPDQTEGTLPGGRPMADHSYLANQALWDAWFLSGIANQKSTTYPANKDPKTLANEFFSGQSDLPTVRYLPETDGRDPSQLVNSFFTGSSANSTGIEQLASYLRVDGMFNINSTSVEAWKSVLGSLRGRQIVVRDASGVESIAPVSAVGKTPVTGLMNPQDLVADGSGNLNELDASQWTGRRELTDAEIDQLARAIIKEIRKRGPFLSLADFVNRRVGTDKDLAKAGAIQCALDSDEVDINKAFRSGARAVSSSTSSRLAFPEAEAGPLAWGIPGYVKQADILTPIAPVLSARSDCFIIRAYGEAVDAAGKPTAKAWCEAVVQRSRNFVDPADDANTAIANLTREANKKFGRRYEIVSFRWLANSEV